MAYIVKNSEGTDVTQAFRNKEYSGSSIYNVKLAIKEKGENKTPVNVPYSQIAKIVISSPIIDTTSNMFYVGSFISQQITITFRNLDNLPIESGNEVALSIGTILNGEMLYVPMGKYLIDDLAEDYHTKCEITCLDYGVKFKPATDIRGAMEQVGANYVGTTNDIFEYICNTYEVDFDENYPKTPNITTGTYDSTISGKQWLSWIAETKGCNVKIDRNGVLKLVPLKATKSVTINALRSKTWELGEPYKITRVRYELEGIENGDTTGNTLYIRSDNPFMAGTREQISTIVENIYNVVKDTEIYALKNENVGDITLDAWDIIEFSLGDKSYLTINDNTITFEQSIMTKIEPKIPTAQQQEVVNVKEEDPKAAIKTIKREINTLDATIIDTITKVDDNTNQITTIKESIDGLEVNFQKSGNNLVRNTMFYDTEGWQQDESITTFKCDTIPENPEDGDTWWCTGKVQNYEENKIYLYDTNTWVLSNLLVSDVSKTHPLGENLTIEASSDTKEKYLSGRALNIVMNGTGKPYPLYSDMFDISPYEDEVTLSFRHTLSFGGENKSFIVSTNFICYDDEIQKTIDKEKYYITPPLFAEGEDVTNSLIKVTYNIPKITNAEKVYYSDTAPTDTTVAWLSPSIDDDTIYLKYVYIDGQWVEMSETWHLIDQNGNLYLPTTYMSGQGVYNAAYKLSDDNTININKAYIVFQLYGNEENPSTCQIGDIKVEYGDYTEWSPKRTEVMGLTHLLDETGYKIRSGDDEMRIMVDEIAQYYKETKTFWLNKYEGYMKNALSDTTNVDGLITTGITVGNNKLYGRYIK
jgi:hypothetical protein